MSSRERTRVDRVAAVWLALLGATLLMAVLGLEQRGESQIVGLVLLAVAFVKLRLVGIHFMELRTAPLPLRLLFEAYAAAAFAVLATLYVAG